MPLTGLIAAARKRTVSIEEKTEGLQPEQVKKEVKRVIDFSAEIEQAGQNKQLMWHECRHLKQAGERNFCKRFMSLCAECKCGSNIINGEERELDLKRLLRGK